MNLHTNAADFNALITFAAKHFNIIPAFVEKDYWITLALSRLSQSENVENAVFKGGTSLSKGYRIINRFSEDIDREYRSVEKCLYQPVSFQSECVL